VIVPRSFCNGPYFKPFRKLLLSTTAFKHIHVFGSRKKAFKEDDVLQENIIFHAIKGGIKDKVMITSSHGPQFEDMTQRSVSYDKVVKPNDAEKFIHITTSDLDQYVVSIKKKEALLYIFVKRINSSHNVLFFGNEHTKIRPCVSSQMLKKWPRY